MGYEFKTIYVVYKHYRESQEKEKAFSQLEEALDYCINKAVLSCDNGHAVSIQKTVWETQDKYQPCGSIFEINYHNVRQIDIDDCATAEELKIINEFCTYI